MSSIVFMGTPEFAVPSLVGLVDAGFKPVAVVTGPDKQRGRGQKLSVTPVKSAAERFQISRILQPTSVKDPAFEEEVVALQADLIIVVAFKILPPGVFGAARLGAFNLHGSLLPKYRGAAPIHRAVMAGEMETGVTTFFLKEKVDTGNMIAQRSMTIGPNETTGDVHDRMMHLGAELVVDTTRNILAGTVSTSEQDESLATPAPKVFRSECKIEWDRPSTDVHNSIRGLSPVPGAWTMHGGKELKLYRTIVPDDEKIELLPSAIGPGVVVSRDEELIISCGTGFVSVKEIQQEGKRRMSVEDFLRGSSIQVGDVLT